jgi:hypothetical protein
MPAFPRFPRARVPRSIPAVLAFVLLGIQAVIPWTSLNFATQDGPSHLYTALIARDLLFNANSPYAAVYECQRKLVTNWSTTVLMNVAELLFGARDAEHAIATLCVVLGFFGFAYLIRSLDPGSNPWSPVLNFLLFNWFLWIGFYNFYLGMAIFPFVAGYFIRHSRAMNMRRAIIVALGLILLFFTHVLPLAIALLCIGLTAVWVNIVIPVAAKRGGLDETLKPLAWFLASVMPALILLLIFVKASGQSTDYEPRIEWAWSMFPMHAFASSQGRAGEQSLLHPAMMALMIIGALSMRRQEWSTPRAAIVVAAVICFFLYLLVPNTGFGGDEIKIRFAWAIFVLGCLVALTVDRLRPIHTPLAIYVAAFLSFSVWSTWRTNVVGASRAIQLYSAALERVPAGSKFIRVHMPTEATRQRFGFERAALDPLFHVDSLMAVRRKLVALSDYQAMSKLFPVSFRSEIPVEKQSQLWDLEGTGTTTEASLKELLKDFPVKIDYVVLLGDGTPPERTAEFQSIESYLSSTSQLAWTDPSKSFVRVYKR